MRNTPVGWLLKACSLAVLLAAGCGSHNKADNFGSASTNPPSNVLLVTGRVVDNVTRAGLGGVTVSLRVTGTTAYSTSTLGHDSPQTALDDSGNFTLQLDRRWVPTTGNSDTNQFILAFSAPGYAMRQMCVSFPDDDPTHYEVFDEGLIEMNKSITFQVAVSLDGKALGNTTVFAVDTTMGCNTSIPNASTGSGLGISQVVAFDGNEITAVTDGTTGIATFQGLDPLVNYVFILPAQNLNAGQLFETETFVVNPHTDAGGVKQPLIIQASSAVVPINNVSAANTNFYNTGLQLGNELEYGHAVIANPTTPSVGTGYNNGSFFSTLANVGNKTFGGGIIDLHNSFPAANSALTAASVQVVFNVPVDIILGPGNANGSGFHWTNDLALPTTINAGTTFNAFPGGDQVIGFTAASNAAKTLWTFTPNTTLTPNQTFILQVYAHQAGVPTSTQFNNGAQGALLFPFYVPGVAAGTTLSVTCDNYNGTSGQSVTTPGTSPAWMQFPTWVAGSYKVLNVVTDSTITGTGSLRTANITYSGGPTSPIIEFRDTMNTGNGNVGGNAFVFCDGSVTTGTTGATTAQACVFNGVRYRVPIQLPGSITNVSGFVSGGQGLEDDLTSGGHTTSVTLDVFAEDVQGNTLSGIVTLPVQ
jgi:hypothetical protein